jgi:photosystem II stability/assembly factor-like uncharacterized protein
MKCDRRSLHASFVRCLVAVLAGFGAACHGAPPPGAAAPDGVLTFGAGALDGVPCASWHPPSADWSSIATSRPVSLGPLAASASGDYVYSVATWFEAGAAKRQILRSHDLGQSWCVLPTDDPVVHVAPSRASESVIYAMACGQSDVPKVLRTADGGATWTAASGPFPFPHGCRDFAVQTSLADPSAIWFADDRLYISRDGAESWSSLYPPQFGPTADNPTNVGYVQSFLVDPRSTDRAFAVGQILTASSGLGAPRSVATVDGGQTWGEVAAPPSSEQAGTGTLFADAGGSIYASYNGDLSRSTNWGETWTSITLPNPDATATTLGSPRPGELYAWMGPNGSISTDLRVASSSDGGATWRYLDVPEEPGVEPELAPGGAGRLVGRDRYGFSFTVDGGRTWAHGPSIVLAAGIVQSPLDASSFSAGVLDPRTQAGASVLLRSDDGGLTFSAPAAAADGAPYGLAAGVIVLDAADANAAYSLSAQPQRTEDGGRSWTAFSFPASGWFVTAATCPGSVPCLYVLLEHQEAGQTDCTLARSDDRGRSWQQTKVAAEICYGARFAVAPDDTKHLVAGCFDAIQPALCDTRDGGQTWGVRAVATDPDRGWQSILFTRDGVVLAATDRSGPVDDTLSGTVLRSGDGGGTWAAVAQAGGQLVASVAHPGTVFLIARVENGETQAGLMRSDDAGASWTWVSPRTTAFGVPALDINAVVDAPDGGFLAETSNYGLVHFH